MNDIFHVIDLGLYNTSRYYYFFALYSTTLFFVLILIIRLETIYFMQTLHNTYIK